MWIEARPKSSKGVLESALSTQTTNPMPSITPSISVLATIILMWFATFVNYTYRGTMALYLLSMSIITIANLVLLWIPPFRWTRDSCSKSYGPNINMHVLVLHVANAELCLIRRSRCSKSISVNWRMQITVTNVAMIQNAVNHGYPAMISLLGTPWLSRMPKLPSIKITSMIVDGGICAIYTYPSISYIHMA